VFCIALPVLLFYNTHVNFFLDPSSGVPLYLQLTAALRDRIAGQAYVAGMEMPSSRALAKELRINYHTVNRAFQALEQEGWIERRRGSPYRVTARAEQAEGAKLLREEIEALVQRARGLGLSGTELLAAVAEALHAQTNQHKKEKSA